MNEEEKKAIKDLKKTIEYYNKRFKENEKITSVLVDNFDVNNLFILCNLIEKQQAEIEKKDKRIEILEHINRDLQNDFDNFKKDKDINYLDGIHHKQLVEKSIGQKIDKPEECWFDIFEVKVIKDKMLYGITTNEDFISLKQISDSDPDNCITVIAESPLSGAIYRYNNYGTKEWQLIGTMLGYA